MFFFLNVFKIVHGMKSLKENVSVDTTGDCLQKYCFLKGTWWTCCFLKCVFVSLFPLNPAYVKWTSVCLKRRLSLFKHTACSHWKLPRSKNIALVYRNAWEEYRIDFKQDTLSRGISCKWVLCILQKKRFPSWRNSVVCTWVYTWHILTLKLFKLF